MSPHRTIIRLSTVLVAVALVKGCGDGDSPTTPPTPEPARPTTLAVSPATTELTALGATVQLSAEVRDQNASVMAGVTITWTSSADGVATVDASGLVTATGNGAATITASAGSASGSAVVTVTQSVASVAVSPATAELNALGETVQLTAEAFDENGHAVAGTEFSWESSDAAVAAVDDGGLVTGVAEGVATITASAGSASGSAVVTVMQPVASVEVSPAQETIGLGSTLQLVAERFDENGDAVEGAEFSWKSNDAAVATVDASGLVAGVAAGVATITASAGSGEGTAEITVMDLERAALIALYEVTDGPKWVDNDGWLTDAPLGEWYGVDTDASGRVVRLDLGGREWIPHGLTGPIPPELGNLANLERLHLGWNDLSGPLPSELGNLANLESLDLGNSGLTGPIPPELGNLSNLWQLYLSSNSLSGPIPPELGNLSSLEWLTLSGNHLTGPIPQSFLKLDRLRGFYIRPNESLCVPGTSAFVAWLREIEDRDESETLCNAADVVALKLLYETTDGTAWTESDGWPGNGAVEDWHGVTADSQGRVTELDLTRNGLVGQLPASLGNLARMTELRIGGNALSGQLPLGLARLSLRTLQYAETELCTPPGASFQTWLNGIPSHEGTGVACAPLSDRDILVALYDATDGPNWTNADNWRTDARLEDWYGVATDGSGQVAWLQLVDNGLSGPLPPELGNLASLEVLELGGNSLSGSIPPELGNLASLEVLELSGNSLSGSIPPELGNLASLEWLALFGSDLTGPIPPELGNLANLTHLGLTLNQLTGPIPPELGDLANLTQLSLAGNDLAGPIPPELGNLASLTEMYLWRNNLAGPIPPELGNLASLEVLELGGNSLSGSIPPELGNLASLENLWLADNELSGAIPPELGDLPGVTYLRLHGNVLSGPIPGELGRLATLEELHLDFNDLVGPVPPEFGGLASLTHLGLTGNGGMSGALSASLTELRRLETLLAGETDLCAPRDPGVQAWLEGVHKHRIAPCAEGDPPAAYLTQAVQSREFPVPLVAGEQALLRVFLTSQEATSAGVPAVRARFYVNGRETHVADIPGKSAPIPTEVDESSLSKSANAEIPGHVVQPGLEMVIEIDPNGTLDPGPGVAKRIPETGRMAVDVRAMPLFDLTVIPFVWTQTGDASIVDLIDAMAADPENHEMLWDTRTLLPVGDLEVTAHEPVMSSSNSAFALRDQARAIRAMEGGTGHYMAMMSPPVTGAGGVAFLPGRASFSRANASTIAHELGHNMNLQHAPCRTSGDPSFPYPDGSIGVWGYDRRDGGSLVRPSRPDLMSYCFKSQWISDYSFTNALRYRLFDEGLPAAAVATRSLLLWGGMRADTVPYLEPAFVVDAPAALPDSAGEYRIAGRTASGGELFSLSFAMPETADGDGSSSFAFVLPVRPGWEGNLASITLSGPGGSVTLDGESDSPMAILRNPRSGQVRGILRDLPPPAQAARASAARSAAPGLEVLFSRGIPDAEAWRR